MVWIRWATVVLASAILVVGGCHRGYYRRQADAEAYALIRQKSNDPRWALPDTTIQVKPESRMHDPFSADHPPLPPDDPSSAKLMQLVDDKKGFPHWHANGDTDYVESPDWKSFLPMNENGVVVIDSPRAVMLGLTHSPAYQRQREELYLSALDVSLQRFGFDTQLFSGFNTFWTHSGRFSGGATDSSSVVELSTQRDELTRLGATGSQLVIGLANTILWQFAGPDTQSASALINFSLIQPLMLGGGRDVILESLTQTERTLLANVRQMERFRQGFFLLITIGRSAGTGPLRGGDFLLTPTIGSGSATGLLGLLRAQQIIRIQEFNVSSLRNVLDQFIEFHKAERLDSLQLSQTESTLYQSESRLLSLRVDYQTQLDQFKRTLGLPPDLPVEIKDDMLNQFELIDDDNNQRQYDIAELKVDVGNVLLDVSAFIEQKRAAITPEPANPADGNAGEPPAVQELNLNEEYSINWSDELKQKLEAILPLLARINPVAQEIGVQDVGRIKNDIEYLRSVRPRRMEALADLRELVQKQSEIRYDIETSILEDSSLEDPDQLLSELDLLMTALAKNQASIEQLQSLVRETIEHGAELTPKDLYKRLDEQLLSEIPKQLTDLASVSLEISLVQARARTDSIEVPEVSLSPVEALQIARCCRLDWMNARASLVDSWRQINVVANQLEAGLDLVLEGNIGNVGDNPFQIRYENGQLRGGVRFDSPLTRLAERNQYREQLIQYQRARRDYYEFEDEINRGLRRTLRDIELNKILFELSRRSIKVSVQQVEQSRLKLEEPPQGITGGAARSQLGATTARDLTDALNRLQNDQNAFLGVWVTYEALRRDLNFDLGTLQLTDDGYWVDPGAIDASIGINCGANRQTADGDFPVLPSAPNAPPVEIQLDPIPIQNETPPTSTEQPSSNSAPRSPMQPALGSTTDASTTPAVDGAPTTHSISSARELFRLPAGSSPPEMTKPSVRQTSSDRADGADGAMPGTANPEMPPVERLIPSAKYLTPNAELSPVLLSRAAHWETIGDDRAAISLPNSADKIDITMTDWESQLGEDR